jgi:hypothetical protein
LGPGAALGPGSWRKGASAITGANRALLGYNLQGFYHRDGASGIQAGRETRHESRPWISVNLDHESAPLGTGRPNGGWLRPAPDA